MIGVVDDVRYYAPKPARALAYPAPGPTLFFPPGVPSRPVAGRPWVSPCSTFGRSSPNSIRGAPLGGVSTQRARVDEALDRWRAPALPGRPARAPSPLVLTMGGLYAVLTMVVGQRTSDLVTAALSLFVRPYSV